MDIYITDCALDSYLNLKQQNAFNDKEFQETIRPDVLRLLTYPNDPKFGQDRFWSAATEQSGVNIPDGYKMKWRQMGNKRSQLRLTVTLIGKAAYLCEAYIKKDEKFERRMLARFKVQIELIRKGLAKIRGKFT
jgi:hypothetical protein